MEYSSKDFGKLLQFLAQDNFWDQLPDSGKEDLELIVKTCLIPNLNTRSIEVAIISKEKTYPAIEVFSVHKMQ